MVKLGLSLIFVGCIFIVVLGLLAALVPALAYATVHSYFQDAPVLHYHYFPGVTLQPFEFNLHIYSAKFFATALSGLIGLFAFARKSAVPKAGVAAVALSGLSLMLPTFGDMRITIPEAHLFDVNSLGGYLAVVGVCLVFLGLLLQSGKAPKWMFLAAPVLLALYSLHPFLVLANYFPWQLFGNQFTVPNIVLEILMFSVLMVMVWGAHKASSPHRQQSETGKEVAQLKSAGISLS